MTAGADGGTGDELAAIGPVGFFDPLETAFVIAPEGIGDTFVAQEIGVDATRHAGGEPASVLGVRSAKFPAAMQDLALDRGHQGKSRSSGGNGSPTYGKDGQSPGNHRAS